MQQRVWVHARRQDRQWVEELVRVLAQQVVQAAQQQEEEAQLQTRTVAHSD